MMRNSNEREEIKWIFTEFNQAKSRGLFVMIDGTYCNSQEEVDHLLLIREEESYMEDYMGDDKGNIIGIAFDKVKIPDYFRE